MEKKMITVAILMSTFNGEKYLKEQIDSILNQKCNFKFDLFVRDDGSTDNTLSILESYSKHKGITYYKAKKNLGAARSFLTLLKDISEYDFYAFSDQDDVWNENKLQNAIDIIKSEKEPALYCSNCELVDNKLKYLGRNVHRKQPTFNLESVLCLASCAQGCTSVLNERLAMVLRKYPLPETIIMHDSLLTILCMLIDGHVFYDHNSSMQYRMHSSNVFGMNTLKQGIKCVLKDRFIEIFKKKKITIYDQAESILQTYKNEISLKNQKICKLIIKSKYSFIARICLVLNPRIKHDTLNKTLTKKIEILLGTD